MGAFLSLEISDSKIRYIVIEKRGKGLAFTKTGVSAFKLDTSVSGALTSFIQTLAATQSVKISRIFLTINRKDTVIQQLNTGKMSKQDTDVFVASEIERIPAFSEQEFEFIYNEYEAKQQDKTKIIFAAIPEDSLKYILVEVKATKIPCFELEIAPLNVVGLLCTEEFKDSLQTLVVLSDSTTQLIVFENSQIKYVYSTNIGQEALQSDGAYSSWAEELKRALKSYSMQNKEDVINKTWIIWDQQKNPGFDELLRKQYNFNVHRLMVLDDLVAESMNPIYLLAGVPAIYSLVGVKPHFSLNHFFRKDRFQLQLSRVAGVCVVGAIIISLAFAGVISHFYQAQNQANKEIEDVRTQISDLQKQSPEIFKIRNEYAQTRDQLLSQATYVKLLNRMSWSEVLSVVASELPEELSLTSFKVSDSGQATFTGEAFRMESVAQMLRKVETSAILKNGKFNYLNQEEVDKKKLFRFGILASIKLGEES